MESDDFTRHYIIRYLSARELVQPPCVNTHDQDTEGQHNRNIHNGIVTNS